MKNFPIHHKLYLMDCGACLKMVAKFQGMDESCKETGIEFTRTFFADGNQLPEAYAIEDLRYFLKEKKLSFARRQVRNPYRIKLDLPNF